MDCVYTGNMVEIYRVSPRVYFRKATLDRGQCNSAFFVGDDGVCIVDPSTHEAAAEMLEEIELLFHKPLRAVFLTHDHADHVVGMPVYLEKPITIYCSHRCAQTLVPASSPAIVVGVRGRVHFHMNGLQAELFTMEDTLHSPWDMLVRFPEEGVLCTGDLVVE
jgi:glyoxylase-like metal-dependent hydrolase (beta-lactamase superfamily II)